MGGSSKIANLRGGVTCYPHADFYKRGVSAKMANLRGGLKVAPTLISTRRVVSAKMVNLRGGGLKMVRKINQAWGFAKYPVFVGVLKIKMAAGNQMSKIGQIWPHKLHFCLAFGSCPFDLDNI